MGESVIHCKIPVSRNECEDARRKCCECPYKDDCDTAWIEQLWTKENKRGIVTTRNSKYKGWKIYRKEQRSSKYEN